MSLFDTQEFHCLLFVYTQHWRYYVRHQSALSLSAICPLSILDESLMRSLIVDRHCGQDFKDGFSRRASCLVRALFSIISRSSPSAAENTSPLFFQAIWFRFSQLLRIAFIQAGGRPFWILLIISYSPAVGSVSFALLPMRARLIWLATHHRWPVISWFSLTSIAHREFEI